jgi:hypothetical protein
VAKKAIKIAKPKIARKAPAKAVVAKKHVKKAAPVSDDKPAGNQESTEQ